MKIIIAVLVAGILSVFISCKKEDVLKGIDKEALFASPTEEELSAIRLNWQQRNLVPADIQIEETHSINDQVVLKMISFRLYGYKQYAGVLLPVTNTVLPVQMYIFGFGLELPYSYQNIQFEPAGTLPFVYIVPALRGQALELTVNGITYKTPTSEGKRDDAFDGAADDAIAALNAVGITFHQADTSTVMVRGGSRGGTVVMLVGERDRRVKRVVDVAGPTDLLRATNGQQNDPTYQFQFLDSLINGTATIAQTRRKLIASSPFYFYSQLPKTQVHLGENDKIVPPWHGQELFDVMKAAGLKDTLELFIYPNRAHDDIATGNTEMNDRISSFFGELY